VSDDAIFRLPGSSPTRSRAVRHAGLVFTVATATTKSAALYDQAREALAEIAAALTACGSSKARILTATIYLADIAAKAELNRAWDAWVDRENPPQRACIGAALEAGDLVEIMIIAAAQTS
jgi:enamine deaminase RidA (YjgF/YER057c/UK114 family)